jgi:hypothetical protein
MKTTSILNIKIENMSDLDKFIYINILVEISKLKKTSLLKECGATLNDFIANAEVIVYQIQILENPILTKLEDRLAFTK